MTIIKYLNNCTELIKLIGEYSASGKLFAFMSRRVAELHPILAKTVERSCQVCLIENEEAYKNIESVTDLWKFLSANGADREARIIAIGGGAITDLSGFTASTYMRGIQCIYVPTTLLSMIDASIGGKTAINIDRIKNLAGTFHQPSEVLILPEFLKTLPQRELLSGFAEAIKHAILSGEKEFRSLKEITSNIKEINWEVFIKTNIEFKQRIVEADEKETSNIRVQLNFGHTFGHAIESLCNNPSNELQPVLHGEAVFAGMICELYLSALQNNGSTALVRDMLHSFSSFYKKIPIECKHYKQLIHLMTLDKKNRNKAIRYISIEYPGSFSLSRIDNENDIKESLDFYRETFV